MENKKLNNRKEQEGGKSTSIGNDTAKKQNIDSSREMGGKHVKEITRDNRYLSEILVTKVMKPVQNLCSLIIKL